MKQIGIMSDSHGVVPRPVYTFFDPCDEIWHAGDIGSIDVLEELKNFKPTVSVFGNIDGWDVIHSTTQIQSFYCENRKILLTHIGGYPPSYIKDSKILIAENKPDLFICGHSHILKVMYDKKNQLLHINPGACGRQGIHTVCTLIRIRIDGERISDLEICEFKRVDI